jgi:hypothetical protein
MGRTLPLVLRLSTAAGLALLVVSHSLAAYLANVNARFPWLTNSQPAILLNDAEGSIASAANSRPSSDTSGAEAAPNSSVPDANLRRIRALASAALILEPLSARALRILGQAATDPENTRRFMDAAVTTSIQETIAALWLMEFNLEHKNYAEAARFADLVLRSQPGIAAYVIPTLSRIAETEGRSEVYKILAANPPWRRLFFEQMGAGISDARTPLQLLINLKTSDAGPSSEEVQSYLALLLRAKLYDLAYYTWLMFLPEEQLSTTGLLANADFKFPLSGQPFDWAVKGGEGIRIGIDLEPDNSKKPALHLSFLGGRVGDHKVSQKLTLSAGKYRMSGRQKGDFVGSRGVRWQVSCLDNPNSPPIALGPMLSGAMRWAPFEFLIDVPAKGCPAQEVSLSLDARSASERVVSGHIWLDDLNIQPFSDR